MPTGLADVTGLQRARQALAAARVGLVWHQQNEKVVRARAEARAIARLGTLGKNEEERKRTLTLELAQDAEYIKVNQDLFDAESAVLFAEADLEAQRDQRRAEEWGIRLQLVIALDRAGVSAEEPGSDESIDEVADEVGLDMLQEYGQKREAWAAQVDRNRAYAEMDEVFGAEPFVRFGSR